MSVIGGESNHAGIAAMIEPLMIPSMKSEVMSTAAKWLDEEQASEWPWQKQGWQPSGLTGCRLKKPGLHLFVTLQHINTIDDLRTWNKRNNCTFIKQGLSGPININIKLKCSGCFFLFWMCTWKGWDPERMTCRRRHMGGTQDTAKKPVATQVALHRGGSLCNDPRNKKKTKKKSQHPGSAH